MIQKLKQLGVPTEAETRGLHHYAEAEMQQIFKPLEASLDGVLNHGLSRAHNLTARDQLDFSTRSQNSTPYNETNSNDVFSEYLSIFFPFFFLFFFSIMNNRLIEVRSVVSVSRISAN